MVISLMSRTQHTLMIPKLKHDCSLFDFECHPAGLKSRAGKYISNILSSEYDFPPFKATL